MTASLPPEDALLLDRTDGLELRLAGTEPPARPYRVVFVDHVARLSGAEIALVRLVRATRGLVEAHVVLGEDGELVAALEEAGATVEILAMDEGLRDVRRGEVRPGRLPLRPLLLSARYVWRLRRRLRRLRPDLVHTNSLKAALYGGVAGRLARVPVVWHVRDRIAVDYLPAGAVRLVRLLSRVLPTSIVANSQSTLATLPATHRGSVLFNPVVPDIAPRPTVRSSALGLDVRSRLRVGIIGRISPWKGHEVFFRAFAQAFRPGEVEAWVIGSAMFGEADYAQFLHRLAEDLGIGGDVVWRGFRPDVAGELAQLDVLVHASTVPEPFGQVIVEGMAAGLPVVAAGAGGPLEIIDSGHDGLLTEPGDVDALADALRTLADDAALRVSLGAAGRIASRRFSPAAARRRLLEIYERTCPAPRRPSGS